MDMRKFAEGCIADSHRWFGFDDRPWGQRLVHMGLGVGGEAGEVLEAIKKHDRGSIDDAQLKLKMEEELTDVLIYLGNIAGLLDIDLEECYNNKRAFNEKRFGNA